MQRYLTQLVLLLLALVLSPCGWAAKTDIVYMKNGDRITGEVKNLSRGQLEFSTDSMGTIFIEWEDILEVVSDTGQSVELTNGQRFYGPLAKTESPDMVAVLTDQGTVGLSTQDVISMYPVEASFWDRLDLRFSLGFSWDKASDVGKYNLGVDAEYRDPRFRTNASLSSEVTTQPGRDSTSRASFDLSHLVYHRNKRFHQLFGTLEQNKELGIDLRTVVGAAYGWVPIRSQRNWFALGAGLAVNHEVPTDGSDETNLEGVGSLIYDYYRYSSPERRFKVDLLFFPNLSDFGRWRASFDMVYSWEFFKDLFWKMDFYANYDSDPISIDASSSDYGVISSLEYKF
jgi:hypothetical protein